MIGREEAAKAETAQFLDRVYGGRQRTRPRPTGQDACPCPVGGDTGREPELLYLYPDGRAAVLPLPRTHSRGSLACR
ncbi:MAG: hypothetical protein IJ713_02085 [Oscillibacter sp.]|nr:hypothetical protein [Oscillibacter sp.]